VTGSADPPTSGPGDETLEIAVARIYEATAILDAIEDGGLLSDLPHDAEAARRHQTGVSLLALLRRDLDAIARDLASAHFVANAMAQLAKPVPRG